MFTGSNYVPEIVPGRLYTKVDIEHGHGHLMVDNKTGDVYGILGYGKVDKARHYGTVWTLDEYYWGDYSPVSMEYYAMFG